MSAAGTKVLAVALAVALAGCATPDGSVPAATAPAAWRYPATGDPSFAARPWTQVFASPELDALVNEALANNADIRIAAERVELARAQFGFARSDLLPGLNGALSYRRFRQPGVLISEDGIVTNRNVIGESSSLVLAVPTWEIDIWGRVRSATEASRRELLASEDARRAVYTSLVAQVVQGYVDLLSLDAQLALSEETARTRRESLRLVELRYRGGVASKLEVADATTLVAQADQRIATVKRLRALSENALSTLVGRNPGPIARTRTLVEHPLPPSLPAGVPSEVLQRRWDIVAAEERIRAADASVDAARKAYFPAITLTGLLGLASPALRDLFDSGRYAWSVEPAIALPVLNWGRLASNVEAGQAQRRIAVEQYKAAVRTAFREVEDGLAAYEQLAAERAALQTSVNANRERLRLSDMRYKSGVASYFEVLDSSRQLFDAELLLQQSITAQYQTVVQVYRALGGGYEEAAATEARPMPATPLSPRYPGASEF